MPKRNCIKKEEWDKYFWNHVGYKDGVPFFLRSIERTNPPDDGYDYIDVTNAGDHAQQWIRGGKKNDD